MNSYPFSVIMSVYKNDNPEQLRTALHSIINQTLPPNEIVVVVDGAIPASLDNVLKDISQEYAHLQVHYEPVNKGLGAALNIAVSKAKYDYLARMDSDDISHPQRFEWQMRVFEEDKDVSVVGGMITEFVEEPNNIVAKRMLPLLNNDIQRLMRSRCAMNHVTVIMKKDALLKAGSYDKRFLQEDYYLWGRMILAGCTFKNVPQVVVNVRSGYEQFARRGGLTYYKDVLGLNTWFYKHGLISLPRLLLNLAVRGIVQLLLPNALRTFVYTKFIRKQ